MSDVTPVGFAATEGQGAMLRRRRNPFWLVLGLVLVVGAAGLVGGVIVRLAGAAPGEGEELASGTIAALDGAATPAVTFTGAGGDYTVWLDHDGIFNDDVSEQVVAATNCVGQLPGGGEARFRGAIQGHSVTIGDQSTIGTFHAGPGEVTIACAQARFGNYRTHGRLREQRPFVVAPGLPPAGWGTIAAITAGILGAGAGLASLARWRGGRVALR
jgi:hypothetical protein